MSFHQSLIQAAYADKLTRSAGLGNAAKMIMKGARHRHNEQRLRGMSKASDPLAALDAMLVEVIGKVKGKGVESLAEIDPPADFLANLLAVEGQILSEDACALVRAHPEAFSDPSDPFVKATAEGARNTVGLEDPRGFRDLTEAAIHARAIWEETTVGLKRDSFGELPNRVRQAGDRLRAAMARVETAAKTVNDKLVAIGRQLDADAKALVNADADAFVAALAKADKAVAEPVANPAAQA